MCTDVNARFFVTWECMNIITMLSSCSICSRCYTPYSIFKVGKLLHDPPTYTILHLQVRQTFTLYIILILLKCSPPGAPVTHQPDVQHWLLAVIHISGGCCHHHGCLQVSRSCKHHGCCCDMSVSVTGCDCGCRRLHCARNTVHIHLFVSFILRALLSLLRDNLLVNGIAFQQDLHTDACGNVSFRQNALVSSDGAALVHPPVVPSTGKLMIDAGLHCNIFTVIPCCSTGSAVCSCLCSTTCVWQTTRGSSWRGSTSTCSSLSRSSPRRAASTATFSLAGVSKHHYINRLIWYD